MSLFTITVRCPRLYWSGGVMYECGEDAEVTIEEDGRYIPASWSGPEEHPTLTVAGLPSACQHVECCDEDGVTATGFYTNTEAKELERRAEQALRDGVEGPEPCVPCRCGDVCRC